VNDEERGTGEEIRQLTGQVGGVRTQVQQRTTVNSKDQPGNHRHIVEKDASIKNAGQVTATTKERGRTLIPILVKGKRAYKK